MLGKDAEEEQSTSSSSKKSKSSRKKKSVKLIVNRNNVLPMPKTSEKITCSAQLRTRSFSESSVNKGYFEDHTRSKPIDRKPYGGGEANEKLQRNDYDILEYVVETHDKRLMPVLRLPSVAIVCIVIFWSFSWMTTEFGGCTVSVVILWAYLRVNNTVVKETLFVISTLGIQVSQENILGRMKHAKFVPIDNIRAVVINEIIRRQRVLSYLLILLDATESTGKIVVPLLIGTLPRLRTIERIYHDIQRIIF
ncbi:unnamed protein product [Orchesella dallaii]|uniref:Phosphatidylinositol N-acetylglucosaminyltransferase subunit H conserved domain-containing protein n=1 Tax=Orchesella dallaii TaxID=48710 RepID=A0ABP1QTQ5_9HEXA